MYDKESGDEDRGRSETASGYELLIVGLACFFGDKDSSEVLLPDGRTPPPQFTPHYPYVVIDPNDVEDDSEWPVSAEAADLRTLGLYELPKCNLQFSGIDDGFGLVAPTHENDLPSLAMADPSQPVDRNSPHAVVRVRLSSGKLEAFRSPDSPVDKPENSAIISRLQVAYAGPIVVVANGLREGVRRMTVKAGKNIAVANIGFPDAGTGRHHFPIYGFLTASKTIADNPQPVNPAIPQLDPNEHHIFRLKLPINDGTAACGNQGCCKKDPPG